MSQSTGSPVIWHDVECGAYSADLSLWEELAETAGGPVLDLGCGTGRVALHLARRGHEVLGLDLDAELVAAFNEWAAGLPATAEVADARDFAQDGRFALAIAPMQLIQLLSSPEERVASLRCIASHLEPHGMAALAIVEDVQGGEGGEVEPIPDVREVDGTVYSSTPEAMILAFGDIFILRRRTVVSPAGELSEASDEVRLRELTAAELEQDARAAGLTPAGRRSIAASDLHIGSTVVLLEKEA